MILNSLADITGDGATHALVADFSKAKWLQITADAGNSATPVRVGGVNTGATNGLPLPAGASMFLPAVSEFPEFYPLNAIYYHAASNDKIYVIYTTEGVNQ